LSGTSRAHLFVDLVKVCSDVLLDKRTSVMAMTVPVAADDMSAKLIKIMMRRRKNMASPTHLIGKSALFLWTRV